jgi:two-component system, OmpR family, response regulator
MAEAKGRVLVVEDDQLNRQMFARAIQSAGYSVDVAANGNEALRNLAATRYDAIVSDVMMPGMDGFELLRRVRSDAKIALTPVVLLTALVGEQSRAQGFGLGADVYLTKPVRFDALVKEVEGAVQRGRKMREDASGAPALGGKLDLLGPVVVLTLLGSQVKTGVLTFRRAATTGTIVIRDGNPVAAEVGGQRGLEAAVQLLKWTVGEFRFDERPVTE